MDFAPRSRRSFFASLIRKSDSPASRPQIAQATRDIVEALEERRLFAITLTNGELLVEGSLKKNNTITVDLSRDGATYGVRVNGESKAFSAGTVGAIRVLGGRYEDYIVVGQNITLGTEIYPGLGNDTAVGGAGNDQIFDLSGGNRLYGGPGDDYISGGAGDETIYGGEGDDVFYGNGGIDRFYGEFGDDYFDGSDKKNFSYGGPGNDKAVNASYLRETEDYPGVGGVKPAASGTFRLVSKVLTVTGSQIANNVINVSMNSAKSAYIVTVGTATQTYKVGTITQFKIIGGAKNDFVQFSSSVTLPSTIDTGAGNDNIYAGSGKDTINGGDGNDRISGGKNNDVINGGNGNDTISGDDGADSLVGGVGDDRIYGGLGRDLIDGGVGTDYADGGADYDQGRDVEIKYNIEAALTGSTDGSNGGSTGGNGGSTGGNGGSTGGNGGSTGGNGGSTGGNGGSTGGDGGSTGGNGGSTGGNGGSTGGDGGSTGGNGGSTGGNGGSTGGNGGSTGGNGGSTGGNGGSTGGNGGSTGGNGGSTGGNGGSTGGSGGSTGGNGGSGGGTIITDVDTVANAPKPTPRIFALATTLNAGQSVFVHGTNSTVGAGSPITARYEWDFGDPDGQYNKLVGFNAAHAYDRPGTYTIKLKIINELRGAAEVTATVTVVGTGRSQIYVASDGNDSNNGSSSSLAVRSWSRAAALVAGKRDVEILFRRGDTFSASTTLSLHDDNTRLAAYGNGVDPIIKWSGAKDGSIMVRIEAGAVGAMVEDLTFDSIWPGPTYDRAGMPFAIKVNGTGTSVRSCTFYNVGYAVNGNFAPTGVLVQDCSAPSPFALRNYLVWGQGTDYVLLGNTVANSINEHAVRIFGVERVNISYGSYSNPVNYDFEPAKNSLNLQEANYVTVFANTLQNMVQVGPLGGEDGFPWKSARLKNVVFESNNVDGGMVRIHHGAENVMIRNNILEMNDEAAIIVDAYNDDYARGVSNLQIINNTGINLGSKGRFLYVGGSVSGIKLVNNLYRADNLTLGQYGASAVYVNDSSLGSFSLISNNVWPNALNTKWVTTSKGGTAIHIVGTTPNRIQGYLGIGEWNAFSVVGTDYQQNVAISAAFAPGGATIAAAGGAKYAGVFTDYYGNVRALSQAWSVGAVEV